MTQNELFDIPELPPEDTKVCVKCSERLPVDHFSMANGGNYRRTECRKCNNALSKARVNLRKIHGLPPDNHVCPICGKDSEEAKRTNQSSFVLDHCHETDTFRGWLCDPCNRGLGAFGDDVERLKKAIDYLEHPS